LRQIIRRDGLLIRKETIVHLPELVLVACAAGRLGRLECVFMDGFQGEIQDDIFHLAGLDVLVLDLGQRLTDVPGAEGSLVIREIDKRDLRQLLALERGALDIEHNILRFSGGRTRSRSQEGLDLL